jgi:hypothetical protein
VSSWVIVLLVVLALVGVFLGPRLVRAYSRSVAMDQCAALEAQLTAMGPGTPAEQRTSVAAQLRACQESIPDLDLGEVGLRRCLLIEQGILQEWDNYKTVQYNDPMQREAKRGTILRNEGDLVRCYRQTLDDTTTIRGAEALRSSIMRSLEASEVRIACFGERQPGCDKSGDMEASHVAKYQQEMTAFRDPLQMILRDVNDKLRALRAREYSRPENVAARAAAAEERAKRLYGGPATQEQKDAVAAVFARLLGGGS